MCTQPENHSSNQGQFWKVGCLSFFQYRTMSQSKVTLLRKPKVDILVKVAWEKRSLLWREATMKMPQDWAPADKLMHSMHDLTVICPISPEQLLAVCPNFVKSTFKTNTLKRMGLWFYIITQPLHNFPAFSTTSLLISWKFPGNPDFTA